MTSTFHVSLELKGGKEVDTAEAVHYKHDGERFPDGQQNTIKLNVNSPYIFTVTIRPAKLLTHWMIRGEKLEYEVKPCKMEDDMSIYQAHWNSEGILVTKRGERHTLPIEMTLDPGLVMKSTLQAKFYPASETTHRKWGPEVHSLEYTCEVPEGHISVDIQHEKII